MEQAYLQHSVLQTGVKEVLAQRGPVKAEEGAPLGKIDGRQRK